jgi:hypothetical protein
MSTARDPSTTPCTTHFHPAVSVSIACPSGNGAGALCIGDAHRERAERRAPGPRAAAAWATELGRRCVERYGFARRSA